MGNCVFYSYYKTSSKVLHHHHHKLEETVDDNEAEITKHMMMMMMIKVITSNGGIMELYSPITVDQITSEFPGHGIFSGPAQSGPLSEKDHLHPGHLYYLLPLSDSSTSSASTTTAAAASSTPYRIMSLDVAPPRSDPDVVTRYSGGAGVLWKVRLVINPEQLSEILSQDAKTEELIESVRTVAKCGTTSSMAKDSCVSDQST